MAARDVLLTAGSPVTGSDSSGPWIGPVSGSTVPTGWSAASARHSAAGMTPDRSTSC